LFHIPIHAKAFVTKDEYLLVATESRLELYSTAAVETNKAPVLIESQALFSNDDQLNFHAPVDSIYVASHLSLEQSGFWLLHYSSQLGSYLYLYKPSAAADGTFQKQAFIYLPLAQYRPKVHYDGRRLIVFGQDHIGYILLVYQVAFNERFPMEKNSDSGGVLNLDITNPCIRFVNRIRHAALGGMSTFDSLHMTCNERFVIVNTKTGNLLAGQAADGLLVIDLEQA
jgi:hypothetical protein